jgi:cytochrome c oxidase subunit 4
MAASKHGGAAAHEHPTPATYAKIAAILCLITLVEFTAFYMPSLKTVLVPLLLVLSAVKFSLVAMFYMHLKFDHAVFTRLLVGGLILGAGVLLALAVLFAFSHPLRA